MTIIAVARGACLSFGWHSRTPLYANDRGRFAKGLQLDKHLSRAVMYTYVFLRLVNN